MREIGQVLERIGKQRSRPLTLILRVASPERALTTAGIDLRQWIKERLAPILVISELQNNYNQSIEPWRTLCRQAGVMLYPAVEAGPAANADHDFYSPLVRNPLAPRHDGQVHGITVEEWGRLQRAAAQNLLAQQPDGIAMFNFPAAGECEYHAHGRLRHELELGSLETLARKDKRYTFYKDLPIYVEANRPRRYHQTIPFTIRGADLRDATVTLRWRWIAEKNPHADGDFQQDPIVKPGLVQGLPERPRDRRKRLEEDQRLPAGFRRDSCWKAHEIVELQVAGSRPPRWREHSGFRDAEVPGRTRSIRLRLRSGRCIKVRQELTGTRFLQHGRTKPVSRCSMFKRTCLRETV